VTAANSLLAAIRGPVLLITVGVLMALDQMDRLSFTRTWPILLILFGLFKLAERTGRHA
jgi:LiaI-LiaF-like transmembrane region